MHKMVHYRPHDSFAMLCLTMKELYSSPKTEFCKSISSPIHGVGVLSLNRYDPAFKGTNSTRLPFEEDPERAKEAVRRGCRLMSHEIVHFFGLRNCIYYECIMNGWVDSEELTRGGSRILCAVCHKKLKCNLRFDSIERFERLAEACEQLGFEEESAIYKKLIADCAASGIKATKAAPTIANQSSVKRLKAALKPAQSAAKKVRSLSNHGT
mmetsp:Transcript_22039/g.27076  ORF Transcript_22039/g.27076 Transcript_22039/m.27076 type:complete len:211 (-) Transcript_22039:169-801(-)